MSEAFITESIYCIIKQEINIFSVISHHGFLFLALTNNSIQVNLYFYSIFIQFAMGNFIAKVSYKIHKFLHRTRR